MINIEGFIPNIDFDDLSQTYSSDKCAYCGSVISVWAKSRGTYVVNNRPICERCIRGLCETYGISMKELFKKNDIA